MFNIQWTPTCLISLFIMLYNRPCFNYAVLDRLGFEPLFGLIYNHFEQHLNDTANCDYNNYSLRGQLLLSFAIELHLAT